MVFQCISYNLSFPMLYRFPLLSIPCRGLTTPCAIGIAGWKHCFFFWKLCRKKRDPYLEYMFFNIPILVHLFMKHITGWWFGTWVDYDFPFSWECHHPNWQVVIFFRAVETTNQLWCKPILTARQTTTKSPPRAWWTLLQCGPSQWCLLVYKVNEHYGYSML